jgi:hypothetical protein
VTSLFRPGHGGRLLSVIAALFGSLALGRLRPRRHRAGRREHPPPAAPAARHRGADRGQLDVGPGLVEDTLRALDRALPAERVWVRVGDRDDYHGFDTIDEAAREMAAGGVAGPLSARELGVEADGFRGQNHVSLFWGRDAGTPSRGLDAGELAHLQAALDEHNDE